MVGIQLGIMREIVMGRKKSRRDKPMRLLRHRSLVAGGIALLSLLGASGILLAIAGVRDWQVSFASPHWPTAEAEIVRSTLAKRFVAPTRFSGSRVTYVREVSFRYAVKGKTYTSDATLPLDQPPNRNDGPLRESTLSAQSNERLMVRYDPSNPQSVVVYPGQTPADPVRIVMGTVVAILCFLLVLVLGSRVG